MTYVTHINRLKESRLTDGEKRVVQELREYGYAECVFPPDRRIEWVWKINGRPVSRPLYGLVKKGWVKIETPAEGAKAFLKPNKRNIDV